MINFFFNQSTANKNRVSRWVNNFNKDYKKYFAHLHKLQNVLWDLKKTEEKQDLRLSLALLSINGVTKYTRPVYFRNFSNYSFLKKFNLSPARPKFWWGILWKLTKLFHTIAWCIIIPCFLHFTFFFFVGLDLVSLYFELPLTIFSFLQKKFYFLPLQLFQIDWIAVVNPLLAFDLWVTTPLSPHVPYFRLVEGFFFVKGEVIGYDAWMTRLAFYGNDHYYIYDFTCTLGGHVLHFVCFTFLFVCGWVAYFNRADPWPFLLNFLFLKNSLERFPSLNNLEQLFGSRMISALSSDAEHVDDAAFSPNIRTLIYDFNTSIGFAGYVGYIDYFPSYDSFFNYNSLKKKRTRLIKLLRRYQYSSTAKITKGFLTRRYRFFNFTRKPFREKYFSRNSKFNRYPDIKKNFQSRPRFLQAVPLPNFLIKFFFFFLTVSPIGDAKVAWLREIVLKLLFVNEPELEDDEIPEHRRLPPLLYYPAGDGEVGNFIDLYQRRVNSVVLSKTAYKKIRTKNSRHFKFGWQNLVNSHTFWMTSHRFSDAEGAYGFYDKTGDIEYEDYVNFAGEDPDTLPSGTFPFTNWNHESPEYDEEDHDDCEEDNTWWFSEDGFLDTEIYPILLDHSGAEDEEEEAEQVTALSDLLPLGEFDSKWSSPADVDDDAYELLELLGNEHFAPGGGQEYDYRDIVSSRVSSDNTLRPERLSKQQERAQIYFTLYDDIVDLHWVNSSWGTFKNFFEYPSERYFHYFWGPLKHRKYRWDQHASIFQNLSMRTPRIFASFLLPPYELYFFYFFQDLFICFVGVCFSIPIMWSFCLVNDFNHYFYIFLSILLLSLPAVIYPIRRLVWSTCCSYFFFLFFKPKRFFFTGIVCIWLLMWIRSNRLTWFFIKTGPLHNRVRSKLSTSLLLNIHSVRTNASALQTSVIFRGHRLTTSKMGWRNASLFYRVVTKFYTLDGKLFGSSRHFFDSFFFYTSANHDLTVLEGGFSSTLTNSWKCEDHQFRNLSLACVPTLFSVSEDASRICYNQNMAKYAAGVPDFLFLDADRYLIKNFFFFKPISDFKKWAEKPYLQSQAGLLYSSVYKFPSLYPDVANNSEDEWMPSESRSAWLANSYPNEILEARGDKRRHFFWRNRPRREGTYFSATRFGSNYLFGVGPQSYSNFLRSVFSWNYEEFAFSERFSRFDSFWPFTNKRF